MRNDSIVTKSRAALKLLVALCLVLGQGGCGLDEVDIPSFDGPSEMANALRLTATPDALTADGFSTAFVQAELRDQNGQPMANRDILFAIADGEGRFADIGTLFDLAGNRLGATDATVRTNAQGLSQIVYRAPPRTDATANQSILIFGRPLGNDFDGQFYRTVRLELRSAEPRLFPQDPLNLPPTPCPTFIVEAPDGFRAGRTILFQSTASDPDGTIVRYEWFFGDGTAVQYAPDQAHVFRFPGTYTVTLIVTDDDGAQIACAAAISVI